MIGYIVLFAVAVVFSATLTPLCIRLAPRMGIMDFPNPLSIHSTATPRAGGIALLAGILGASIAALTGLVPLSDSQSIRLLGLLVGVSIVTGVGILDDMQRIAPEVKFCWEIVGALVTLAYGVQIGLIPIIWIALPLTILYLVGGANAFNLLDGMDGLAAGIGATAAVFLGAMALIHGSGLAAVLCLIILGVLLGFLPFNIRPAKTFMGDSGSLQLGFLLGAVVALISRDPYDWIWFLSPLVVLAIPLLDTSAALFRRRVAGGDMFTGDRRHFYDLLRREGISYRNTVVSLWVSAVGLGAASLLAVTIRTSLAVVVIGAVCTVSLVIAWRLGVFFVESAEAPQDSGAPFSVGGATCDPAGETITGR